MENYIINLKLAVEKTIKKSFSRGTLIGVKHVKRKMGVPASSRSRTAFISRVMDALARDGALEFTGKRRTKRYKVMRDHL